MNGEIDGQSLDVKAEKLEQLRELFPEFFSEGRLDLSAVREVLGDDELASPDHYELSWAGKAEARREIQKRTAATIVPNIDDSISFETSGNVFIEGENLEVLRTLQKAYFGRVKTIFIDPPYNTGNDSFVYPDDYAERKEDYEKRSGLKNGDGYLNKLDLFKKNTKENGQYHSVWLSMMYPRLYLARNLLAQDGVMLISIDDNEAHNLRIVLNEIFGEESFIGSFVWQSRTSISNDQDISLNHNHIFVYGRDKARARFQGSPLDESEYSNPDDDPRGPWKPVPIDANKPGGDTRYGIINPNTGVEYFPPTNRSWSMNRHEYKRLFDDNRISFGVRGEAAPKRKMFLNERLQNGDTKTPSSVLLDAGTTQDGTNEVADLFGGKKVFSYPKPTKLLVRLLEFTTDKDSIVMDFFAGSGTTAAGVLALNQKDGGDRKFICIQMAEPTDQESEAFKAGYPTISALCSARIKKEIEKIEAAKNGSIEFEGSAPDLGFRSYTLQMSNFKQWKSEITDREELLKQLNDFKEPLFKKPSSSFDLLTELLLKSGLPLSSKTETRTTSDGISYYVVEDHTIYALDSLSPDLLKDVEAARPTKFFSLGNLFTGEKADETMTNWRLQLQEAGIAFTLI
jgi:adenine-specific DNA-methyltransferase